MDTGISFQELFESQVKKSPDSNAVTCGDDRISYFALNLQANQLANYLRSMGVGPETMVGICVSRSIDMVVGILGILKAGGAYVPLDPAYPKQRVEFILEDARAQIIITQTDLVDLLVKPDARVICLDRDGSEIAKYAGENQASIPSPESLAYVIYTSGSTGKPKGVMITHSNLGNFIRISQAALDVSPHDIYLHNAPIAYALSVRQFAVPLTAGATIALATSEQTRDPLALFDLIKKQNVTLMDMVPSFWRASNQRLAELPKEERQNLLDNRLRRIVSVGEPLYSDIPHDWTDQFNNHADLVNIFGQTETTGVITTYPISHDLQKEQTGTVPIGRAIPDTRLYILNSDLQPATAGETGELCVSNPCLARGYLNQPQLTAEKFISNPFHDGISDRLYLTGDMAYYREDGNIQFLGRNDHQVKIRGQRLELSEVEFVLRSFSGIHDCVVVARGDQSDEKYLAAYIVPSESISIADIRKYLRDRIPAYMVPSSFVFLKSIPLTPNGKVDRMALPDPRTSEPSENLSLLTHPRNDIERKIAGIWQDLLKRSQIGIHDNFFDLGGHSLLAVKMFSQIEQTLGVSLPLATFLRAPTISSLAKEIQSGEPDSVDSKVLIPFQRGGRHMSPFFCAHGVGGGVMDYSDLVRALGSDVPFYALRAFGLEDSEIHDETIEALASRYINVIRAFQPHGPYQVGGYCFGGVVAYEIACQLENLGEKVDLVAIFEGFAPRTYVRKRSLFFFHPRRLFAIFKSIPSWIQDYSSIGITQLMRRIRSTISQFLLIVQRRSDQRQRIRVQDLLDTELDMIPDKYVELTLVHIRALRRYIPGSYGGQVTLFRARTQSINEVFFGSLDPEMGWGKVARGGVDVRVVNGFHRNIHMRPYVESLSAELRTSLNRSSQS